MFKFKMLTKVLVAVFVLGQLIESNLNLCIALSIDLDAPVSSVKLHKTWQSSSEAPIQASDQQQQQQPAGGDAAGPPGASRAPASTTTTTTATTAASTTAASDEPATSQLEATETSLTPAEVAESERRIVQKLESNGKLSYFGKIYVGAQKRDFMVLFDLTSSSTWLPSSECASFYCISRQKYDRVASGGQLAAAADDNAAPLAWTYNGNLQAARVSARLVRDQLTFAGLTIDNQTFGEALTMDGEPFARLPVDGFLGLGLKDLNGANATSSSWAADDFETPIERLWRAGHLKEPIFSLLITGDVDEWNYSADNGELVLGQLAPGYQASELTYVPVTHVDYWEFRLAAVTLRHVNGDLDVEQACESACPAILDTGTTLISGHFTDVDRLNRALGGFAVGNGLYRLAHCDLMLMPNLIFTIGGAEFSLRPEEYVTINKIRGNIVSCYSALRVVNADQYPFWILGEQFLKRHYVVFDYGQKRLGFAKSKRPARESEADILSRIGRRKKHII